MRIAVVANEGDADAGVIGRALIDRGATLGRLVREHPGDWPELAGAGGPEALVLLGSDWSVYWPDVARFVEAEAALVRSAHVRGVPVFAICFGAQVVAHALGGTVERAPRPEVGWYELETFHHVVEPGPWLQWHVDRFSVPPGFGLLARSDIGPQAVLGARTFAVQFHPEIDASIVERWASGGGEAELAGHGVDRDDLLTRTVREAERSAIAAERLVEWFLEDVAGTTLRSVP
jgi:GMP synthase-like glutamine amidotransferase